MGMFRAVGHGCTWSYGCGVLAKNRGDTRLRLCESYLMLGFKGTLKSESLNRSGEGA